MRYAGKKGPRSGITLIWRTRNEDHCKKCYPAIQVTDASVQKLPIRRLRNIRIKPMGRHRPGDARKTGRERTVFGPKEFNRDKKHYCPQQFLWYRLN